VLASLTGRAAPGETLFEARAPEGMITGRVRLQAVTRDGEVAFVKWQIEDWSRSASRSIRPRANMRSSSKHVASSDARRSGR